jgi:uncharacterized protein YecE (DUF72 family)
MATTRARSLRAPRARRVAARVRIGCSGWNYRHWRERFYPEGLAPPGWLGFYSERFDTVEINNTFYRLPLASSFDRWREESPEGFVFAVKASRFITHLKRLKDVAAPLDLFLSRARRLEEKLGPILFQLPPNFHRDDERLERFLALLPRDLAFAVELRDPSWAGPDVHAILRCHGVASCVMVHPALREEVVATARFVYVRFHAPPSGVAFGRARLERWAERLRELAGARRRAWIYFNNDAGGAALEDAATLRELLADLA